MDTKRVKYFSTEFRGDLSSEERGKGWVLGSQKESFWEGNSRKTLRWKPFEAF